MGLTYPPAWKFGSRGVADPIPAALIDALSALVSLTAKDAQFPQHAVERMKVEYSRLLGSTPGESSTFDWSVYDLKQLMTDYQGNAAPFVEALWAGFEAIEAMGIMIPPLANINHLLHEHGVLLEIAPPRLVLAEGAPKPVLAQPAIAALPEDRNDTSSRFSNPELLGRGQEGAVWKYWDNRLERAVAIKFLSGRRDAAMAVEQGKSLASFDSEHIVKVFDSVELEHPESGLMQPSLILELVEGETLSTFLQKQIPIGKAKGLATQLVSAVQAFRESHFVHGDLHTENVMVTSGRIKVLDPWYSRIEFMTKYSSLSRDGQMQIELADCREIVHDILRQADYDSTTRADELKAVRASVTVQGLGAAIERFGVKPEVEQVTVGETRPEPGPVPSDSGTENAVRAIIGLGGLASHNTPSTAMAASPSPVSIANREMVERPSTYDPADRLNTTSYIEVWLSAKGVGVDFAEWKKHFFGLFRIWSRKHNVLARANKVGVTPSREEEHVWRADYAQYANEQVCWIVSVNQRHQLVVRQALWSDHADSLLEVDALIDLITVATGLFVLSLDAAIREHREEEPSISVTVTGSGSGPATLNDRNKLLRNSFMLALKSKATWATDLQAPKNWSIEPKGGAARLASRLAGRVIAQFETDEDLPSIGDLDIERATAVVRKIIDTMSE